MLLSKKSKECVDRLECASSINFRYNCHTKPTYPVQIYPQNDLAT